MNEEGQSFTGGHVPKDKDQAETFYREAAKNGDAVAQYEVGRLLVHSLLDSRLDAPLHWTCVFDSWRAASCKIDEKVAAEALNLYSNAADQGHAQARYQLAALYSRPLGYCSIIMGSVQLLGSGQQCSPSESTSRGSDGLRSPAPDVDS